VLLQQGAITRAQLDLALVLQRQSKQRLGEVLIERGILSEARLMDALAEALGIPKVDLRAAPPDRAALKLLKPAFCEAHGVFPFAFETQSGRKRLVTALADPLNLSVLEEMTFTTGHAIAPRLASPSEIRSAIAHHFHGIPPSERTDTAAGEEFVILHEGGAEAAPEPPPALLVEDAPEELGELERKFWTLMRLLVKKRVITQAEFDDALKKGL
jgi:type IV pilus assembly protein PilB